MGFFENLRRKNLERKDKALEKKLKAARVEASIADKINVKQEELKNLKGRVAKVSTTKRYLQGASKQIGKVYQNRAKLGQVSSQIGANILGQPYNPPKIKKLTNKKKKSKQYTYVRI